jgi:hypothetical protein
VENDSEVDDFGPPVATKAKDFRQANMIASKGLWKTTIEEFGVYSVGL